MRAPCDVSVSAHPCTPAPLCPCFFVTVHACVRLSGVSSLPLERSRRFRGRRAEFAFQSSGCVGWLDLFRVGPFRRRRDAMSGIRSASARGEPCGGLTGRFCRTYSGQPAAAAPGGRKKKKEGGTRNPPEQARRKEGAGGGRAGTPTQGGDRRGRRRGRCRPSTRGTRSAPAPAAACSAPGATAQCVRAQRQTNATDDERKRGANASEQWGWGWGGEGGAAGRLRSEHRDDPLPGLFPVRATCLRFTRPSVALWQLG